jgi:hypothetical protein
MRCIRSTRRSSRRRPDLDHPITGTRTGSPLPFTFR